MKKWIIKNWLTILMYVMFFSTYRMYIEGVDKLPLAIMYILTMAVTRSEGSYKESQKTDFFYKLTMTLMDNLKETNDKIKELQKTAAELQEQLKQK